MNPYNTLQLADIDLSELKLVKETCHWFGAHDHSRWLFKTRGRGASGKDGFYYKIWNPTYVRRDHLLRGLECGFYDETIIPAFHAVIFSQGICRGYVMRKCLPHRRKDPIFHASVLEKTAQTGFFCVQYSRFHTMRYGEKSSLVDLEAIHPLAELPLLSSHYHCFFDDLEYERFVINLYSDAFPSLEPPQPTKQTHTSAFLPEQILTPFRKAQSLYRNLYRRLLIYRGTIFNHIERIEY
jgi:hypothetical protein